MCCLLFYVPCSQCTTSCFSIACSITAGIANGSDRSPSHFDCVCNAAQQLVIRAMCWYHRTAFISTKCKESDPVLSATCIAPSPNLFRCVFMQVMQSQNHVAGLEKGTDVDTAASTSQLDAPAQNQIRCNPCTGFFALDDMHHRALNAAISDLWTHSKLFKTCVEGWQLVFQGSSKLNTSPVWRDYTLCIADCDCRLSLRQTSDGCLQSLWVFLPESVTVCAHAGGPKVLQAQQVLLWSLSLSCSSSRPVNSRLITRKLKNRRSKLRLKLKVSSTAKARRMALWMEQALQKISWLKLMKLLSCLLLQVLLWLLCQVRYVCVPVTKIAHTFSALAVFTTHNARF